MMVSLPATLTFYPASSLGLSPRAVPFCPSSSIPTEGLGPAQFSYPPRRTLSGPLEASARPPVLFSIVSSNLFEETKVLSFPPTRMAPFRCTPQRAGCLLRTQRFHPSPLLPPPTSAVHSLIDDRQSSVLAQPMATALDSLVRQGED